MYEERIDEKLKLNDKTNSFHLKVNEVSRKLLEEEELCGSVANSIKKFETDAKKISEEIQNMEFK